MRRKAGCKSVIEMLHCTWGALRKYIHGESGESAKALGPAAPRQGPVTCTREVGLKREKHVIHPEALISIDDNANS